MKYLKDPLWTQFKNSFSEQCIKTILIKKILFQEGLKIKCPFLRYLVF
jgi:hypothetical protein